MSEPTPGKIRHYYIGACSLLARLSSRRELSSEDKAMMRQAVEDCADMFPDSFEVMEVQNDGVSLEPKL